MIWRNNIWRYCRLEGGGGATDHLYPAGVQKGTVVVFQSFLGVVLRSEPHKSKLTRLAIFGANDLCIGNLQGVEENGRYELTAPRDLSELQMKEATTQSDNSSTNHCVVRGWEIWCLNGNARSCTSSIMQLVLL